MSDRAAVARGATLLHRAWGNANETRTKPERRHANVTRFTLACL
jgi:hypothetical protein